MSERSGPCDPLLSLDATTTPSVNGRIRIADHVVRNGRLRSTRLGA